MLQQANLIPIVNIVQSVLLRRSLVAAVALVACDTSVKPTAVDRSVLVDMSESGGFVALNQDFSRLSHHGNFGRVRSPMALSPNRNLLYFVAAGNKPREFVVFSAERLEAEFRRGAAELESQSNLRNVFIAGRLAIAVLDENTVIVDGVKDGIPGILKLQGPDFVPIAFAGPYYLSVVGAAAQGSSLFVLASRRAEAPRFLFELDPATLAVKDSVDAPDSRQVVASPDGRHLYLYGDGIRKFDTTAGEFTATVPNPTASLHSRLFVSRNGRRLYVNDPGDYFDVSGPGLIYSWTSELSPLPAIDLRDVVASQSSVPPIAAGLATSRSGDTLFISTGTRSIGPLYGPQPAQLLIVEAATHELIDRVELEGWNPGTVVPLD